MIDLARRGPSAGHTQGWHFLVLDDAVSRESFWTATTEPDDPPDDWLRGMRTAPVLIIALSDRQAYVERYREPDKGWTDDSAGADSDRADSDPGNSAAEHRWPVPYWHVDTGMASMLILLGAVDRGLGACFVGVPGQRVPALRTAFGVPDRLVPVGVINLGHPAPDRRSPSLRRGRRDRSQTVS